MKTNIIYSRSFRLALLVAAVFSMALSLSTTSLASPKPISPQVEKSPVPGIENLNSVKHAFFDDLLINQSKPLNASNAGRPLKVYITPGEATFSRYWLREHRTDVSRSYKSKTLERYSQLLNDVLVDAIDNSEYFEPVSERQQADLIFIPKLERLNIFAPDDKIGKSFAYTSGNAKFNLLVVDGQSGEAMVQFIDARETRHRGNVAPLPATRLTNTHDFKWLMKKWAKRSLEYLEGQD